MSWRTIGNEKIIASINRALSERRLPHAYLFVGPRHIGKMTMMMELAAALNCTGPQRPCGSCSTCDRTTRMIHTDVHVISLQGLKLETGRRHTAITIEQIRDAQRDAALTPFEGQYRIIIIDGADQLSEAASNSLLKTLEEPPDNVVILLSTSKPEGLLQTVTSRCHIAEFKPVPKNIIAAYLEENKEVGKTRADHIARLSNGLPGWAIRAVTDPEFLNLFEEIIDNIGNTVQDDIEGRFAYAAKLGMKIDKDREAGLKDVDLWLGWWRDLLFLKENLPEFATTALHRESIKSFINAFTLEEIASAIKTIHDTKILIERNVNPRLALEVMMLDLPKLPLK